MATIKDNEDTIEAESLSTTLDPYGQLIKMLMPRALCIAIYEAMGMPLWSSEGYDGPDLLQLVEEALNSARSGNPDPEERDGFARTWDGDTAYVFILRQGSNLLGAAAISCRDTSSGARPFSLMLGLLRPALQVLARELAHQGNVAEMSQDVQQNAPSSEQQNLHENLQKDLQKERAGRDGDFELLLNTSGSGNVIDADDFDRLVQSCVTHLDCNLGALLVPDKKLAVAYSADEATSRTDFEMLDGVQRHLLAWAQVQRRTLTLNKAPPNSPLSNFPHKILACPIQVGVKPIVGVFALFRPATAEDFDLRQVRIAELLARRFAYALQNSYDSTTGLLTHPALEQRVFATLASGTSPSRHCVAYGDVDRLHAVNENHGMHVGDELLARVADTICNNLSQDIIASHICGDRFALFLPNAALGGAQRFLEDLRKKIAAIDFNHEGRRIEASISFGLAGITDTKLPLSHAIAAAETACKAAKELGRGRVETYRVAPRPTEPAVDKKPVEKKVEKKVEKSVEPAVARTADPIPTLTAPIPAAPPPAPKPPPTPRHDDVAVLNNLRDAIAADRFRMEAQPIIQIGSTAAPRQFELLLRMIEPSGESVAPEKFLAAAERNGLATDIDRWVVQYALEILSSAAPALQSLGASFAINLSAQSVIDTDFAEFLARKLREYELPPSLMSFEIAETAAVANIVSAETLIRRLQSLGHEIVLDDFGRGLSSLSYLKSLSVSGLKIDGGLVRDLAGSSRSHGAITAIVQLARTTRLKTTAKCVESEPILAAVTRLGLDYGQGFAVGRPRSLEIVLQELLRGAGVTRMSGSPMMSRLAG
jgi:diguanylate cyclase (GGDEF)-like protein